MYYIFKVKSKMEISSIFVAFLENMNFTQNHYMYEVCATQVYQRYFIYRML